MCLRVCVLGDSILVDSVTKAARILIFERIKKQSSLLSNCVSLGQTIVTGISSDAALGTSSQPLFYVGTKRNALQSVHVNDQTVFPGGLNSETKWVLFLPRREYVGPVRNLQFSRNTTVIGKRQPHAYSFLSAHDLGARGWGHSSHRMSIQYLTSPLTRKLRHTA